MYLAPSSLTYTWLQLTKSPTGDVGVLVRKQQLFLSFFNNETFDSGTKLLTQQLLWNINEWKQTHLVRLEPGNHGDSVKLCVRNVLNARENWLARTRNYGQS